MRAGVRHPPESGTMQGGVHAMYEVSQLTDQLADNSPSKFTNSNWQFEFMRVTASYATARLASCGRILKKYLGPMCNGCSQNRSTPILDSAYVSILDTYAADRYAAQRENALWALSEPPDTSRRVPRLRAQRLR
eukprot:2646930-Prymnesium_polylepis.1